MHPGLVETNLATSVENSRFCVTAFFSAVRKFGLIWPANRGSWTSLFCVASQDMKAEQSGMYFEIFRCFAEPRWQNSAAKDTKLAEKLERWTEEVMREEGWAR